MPRPPNDFLISALTEENPFLATAEFLPWFRERRRAHQFRIDQIPFDHLDKWGFDATTGNLAHDSGKFFSIEGIRVRTNFGGVPEWDQPIINQPEVGILGILAARFDGILHFLMQVKMEPGNINLVQLAPTLQATRSNFTAVHKGGKPPYLDEFLNKQDKVVLVDVLQSEQGARFLRKRNRNIILEVSGELEVLDDFCWLTLGQIHRLMQLDNLVNMDARTVISCIPFTSTRASTDGSPAARGRRLAGDLLGSPPAHRSEFKRSLLASILNRETTLFSTEDILSWFTEHKVRYRLEVERIPLRTVRGWARGESELRHESGRYFSVIACQVEADNREVASWSQPLVRAAEPGIIALLCKRIRGVLHFLIQAKVEPGTFDVVEMAPTVQCVTGSYRDAAPQDRPPYLDYVLAADPSCIRLDTMQSEEGGRFYQEQNRNVIIEVDEDFPEEVPDNYIWMTAHQLKELIKFNNFVNVQCRCLTACLALI